MERATLLAKLAALERYQLVYTLSLPPIWNLLINMLRPMDIVSLAIATQGIVQPRKEQVPFYMKWWRQIFYNIKWFDNTRRIVIIGQDLVRLDYAIKTFRYFDTTKMKLLVMVREILLRDQTDEARWAFVASLDTPYMWQAAWKRTTTGYQAPVLLTWYWGQMTCVIFYNDYCLCADLPFSWGRNLLEEIPVREPIIVDGDHYNQHPDGSISRYPDVGHIVGLIPVRPQPNLQAPWFRVAYINMRLPNRIEQSSTRTDYTNGFHPLLGYMRIAIRNGSVIVPIVRAEAYSRPGSIGLQHY
jgi:hypothetical protein